LLSLDRRKLAQAAAIEPRREELLVDWSLAVAGQEVFKVRPLK
jgi:hypothetical protein